MAFPVVCMDEQPVQLLKENRVPTRATRNHPRRVDYEYERAGTLCIFMFFAATPRETLPKNRIQPSASAMESQT